MNRKPFRSQKLKDSAKDKYCTLNFPGCRNNTATVVLCHSNYLEDGKGKGQKAHEYTACFGCGHCHDILDGRKQSGLDNAKEEIRDVFHRAMKETWQESTSLEQRQRSSASME